MSLLMEALRKAEAAKRAGQDAATPDTGQDAPPTTAEPATTNEPLQLVPEEVVKYTSTDDLLALVPREEDPVETAADSTPVGRQPGPRITDNDDVLDDYLTTTLEPELDEVHTPLPTRERVKVQEQRGRAAAASMFEAKVPQDTINTQRRQRIQILAGALVVVVTVVGGISWYLIKVAGNSSVGVNQSVAGYNLQKRGFLGEQPTGSTPPATGNATAAQVAPTTASATQAPAANPATAAISAKADGVPEAGKPATNTTKPAEVALAVSDPKPAGATGSAATTQNPVLPPGAVLANAPAAASPPAGNVLEISRSRTAAKVQPELQSAYNQLQKGNLSAANDLYQELVSRYPNNRNALLGLADVQLKLGNQNGARSTYALLLKLNPLDALARTGMLQAIPNTDPASYEKELLALRQQFPALAALSFALGNHYAKDGHWHEAQSAYFDALLQARHENADSVSPDYAFNLAVSLEQLGQKSTALEYYKQADSLARSIKPGFDPMMLRQRLTELEQQK